MNLVLIVESITLIVEMLAVLICLANTFGKPVSFDVYLLVLIILDIFLLTGVKEHVLPECLSLLVYVGIFMYCFLHYKSSIMIAFINSVISVVIIGAMQLVFYIIFFIFLFADRQVQIRDLLVNLGCLLSVIRLNKVVNLKLFADFLQQKNRFIKIVIISLMLFGVKNIFLIQNFNSLEKTDFVQILNFIVIFFLLINEWQKAKTDADKKEMQLKMSSLYYGAYDELLELVREKQHDMKNHISAILGMIYTIDNYDDLVQSQKEYCHDILENDEGTRLLLSTENPLIAGFLYRKFQEAHEQSIQVDYKIAIKESESVIPKYELVEMLGILLDNAMDVLRDKEIILKKIYIELVSTEADLQIKVANTSKMILDDEIKNFFQKDFTSKGKGHGIGLKKLKRMVREKKGEIIALNQVIDSINYIQFNIIIPREDITTGY